MQTEHTLSYHRLSLRTFKNPEGVEGWALFDRRAKRVIMKGGGRDGSAESIHVIERFIANERMEALLCSEIDREWPQDEGEAAE